VEESSPKFLPTFVIFKKVPKVNNRPIGEISPNLVTLVVGGVTRYACENIAQNVAEPVFCQDYYIAFTVVKIGQKLGKRLQFIYCNKLPKVNAHPTGENSPNMLPYIG
jgi:hypothetical protein